MLTSAPPPVLSKAPPPTVLDFQYVHIDSETQSDVDPKLVGFNTLARNCNLDIVTWSNICGHTEMPSVVHRWDAKHEPVPLELLAHFANPKIKFVAFNAGFDSTVFKHTWGFDIPDRWCDSGSYAAVYGINVSSLSNTAKTMQCRNQKIELVKGLMNLFAGAKLYGKAKTFMGRKLYLDKDCTEIDPDYYAELRATYLEYAEYDVWTSAEIWVKSAKMGEPYPYEDYNLHQKINNTGIGVDLVAVDLMIKLSADLKEYGKQELRNICQASYEVASHQGFARWLKENVSGWTKGSSKDEVMELAHSLPESDPIHQACLLKVAVTGTAAAKYTKIKQLTNPDGRMYDTLRFNGASRTGRPSGSGAQLLNLARPTKYTKTSDAAVKHFSMPLMEWIDKYKIDAPTVAAKIVRAVFVPEAGYKYVDFDYVSIENVLLMYFTQDHEGLRVRAQGLDPYVYFGSKMFNKPYEEITKDERQIAKPPVLGAGYGMAGGALADFAKNMGVYKDLKVWKEAIKLWRETHTSVPLAWESLHTIFKNVCLSPPGTSVPVSVAIPKHPAVIERHRDRVVMRFPSGRGLHYLNPSVDNVNVPYVNELGVTTSFKSQSFTYRNNKGSKSWQEGTHGGKLIGNSCQGIGNDLLRDWLRNVDEAGLNIVLHVYDQIVAEVKEDEAERASEILLSSIPAVKDPNHWSAGWGVDADGGVIDRFWK